MDIGAVEVVGGGAEVDVTGGAGAPPAAGAPVCTLPTGSVVPP